MELTQYPSQSRLIKPPKIVNSPKSDLRRGELGEREQVRVVAREAWLRGGADPRAVGAQRGQERRRRLHRTGKEF